MITYTVYVSEYYENEKCARAIATGLSLPEAMEMIKLREESCDTSADMCTDEEWMNWEEDEYIDVCGSEEVKDAISTPIDWFQIAKQILT